MPIYKETKGNGKKRHRVVRGGPITRKRLKNKDHHVLSDSSDDESDSEHSSQDDVDDQQGLLFS